MTNNLMNLDAFKAGPAQAFRGLDASADNLADGIGQSYGVIGYKGKVWSLRLRGQTYYFVRPDDQSPLNALDVIILRQAHLKSKSYYTDYVEGQEGTRPICASINGVVPDLDVQHKQADACAICPRNAWKTDPTTGRKGRECTDFKRLAVLILPNLTKPLIGGNGLMEPVFLRVPPASLNSLATMGETMSGQGWHPSTYITRITFDPTKAHPEMVFRPLQPLTDGEAPIVLPLRDDSTAKRITGEDQVDSNVAPVQVLGPASNAPRIAQQTAPAPQPAPVQQQPQPVPQAPVQQPAPVQTQQPVQEVIPPAQPVQTGFATSAPAPQPQQVVAPSPAPQQFTQAIPETPVQQAAVPQQVVSDVGMPQESDAAMDERIAALMLRPNA